MKLRISSGAIRLRLGRTELDEFAASGRLENVLHFPHGSTLVYVLEATDRTGDLEAAFDDARLTVRLPREWIEEWTETDRVGFEASLATEAGDGLTILVEKDFDCLHKATGAADAFPHPEAERTGG